VELQQSPLESPAGCTVKSANGLKTSSRRHAGARLRRTLRTPAALL